MKSCALFLSLLLTLAGSPAWAEGEYAPVAESRREIDLRIAALDAERARISTKGPKTATLIGLLTAVGGGIAFGVGISRCCDNDEPDPAAAIGTGIALLSAGGITAIVGGIVWGVRAKRRNEIDAERESLIGERDGLAATLSRLELRSPNRNGTQFVTLGVRF